MRTRFALLLLPLFALLGCGPKPTEQTLATPGEPPLSDADARTLAKKRLTEIVNGLHEHESTHQQLPGGRSVVPGALSWRVHLLPFVGQEELFKQFNLKEAWDSEQNKPLIEKMPAVYASPDKTAPAGQTYIQGFVGPHAFFASPPADPKAPFRGRSVAKSFPDGTSNVLAVAEAAEPVIWTKPDDLPFDGKELPKLGGVFPDGFHGVMADGQVFFFPKDVTTDALLRSLLTIDGNDWIDFNSIRKANGMKELEYRKPTPLPNPNGPKPPVAKPPG